MNIAGIRAAVPVEIMPARKVVQIRTARCRTSAGTEIGSTPYTQIVSAVGQSVRRKTDLIEPDVVGIGVRIQIHLEGGIDLL